MAGSLKDLKSNFRLLYPGDFISLLMLFILTVIISVFNSGIHYWQIFIPLNLLLIYLIYKSVVLYESNPEKSNIIVKLIRYWYGIFLILYIFKQVYFIIFSLKPPDWDHLFIKMDYWIFGLNPTEWIYRFQNPFLTEFLQIVYIYYYPMILVFGLQLYLPGRYGEFKFTLFVLFFSFYISYLLYMVFPAIGPRFHLHNFYSISTELPGLFLTEPIRDFINFGESIPPGVLNPDYYVQRDAMPSLHVISAFLILWLSGKFRMKSFYFYLPYFIFMVIATVYLRYHYIVDIFGGLVVCWITVIVSNVLIRKSYFKT
ncbi:MAG: phosphatase PAP2 family protein [Ignavibacteria bacterium]|nr:phosphatase PAP2 family protein [Ignavibacteria bacterium]